MEQRRPLYASVATHTIATDARSPEEIAAELAALLKNPG
jgi:shikimate kinase